MPRQSSVTRSESKVLTYDQWADTYNPVFNVHKAHASFENTAYETYGEEFQTVMQADMRRVWTLVQVDSDDDEVGLQIVSGLRFVNRLLYFITKEPVDRGQTVIVKLGE